MSAAMLSITTSVKHTASGLRPPPAVDLRIAERVFPRGTRRSAALTQILHWYAYRDASSGAVGPAPGRESGCRGVWVHPATDARLARYHSAPRLPVAVPVARSPA